MKKGLLTFCLGLLVACGISGNDMTAQAADNSVEDRFVVVNMEASAGMLDIAMDVETLGIAEEEGMEYTYIQSYPIHEGYYNNARIDMEGEIPALNGVESWGTSFKLRIADGIRNFKNEVDVSDLGISISQTDQDAMVDLYQEVLDGNPDFFYATGGFFISYPSDQTIVKKVILSYSEYYSANENGVLSIDMNKINAYKEAKAQAMSVVKEGMTDVEKALALHDYLALNCSFDYVNYLNNEIPKKSYTSYGALVDRKAVGVGYAMAYAELVRTAGIPCYVVSSKEMGHVWNLLYVDGAWFHVDVCFDDPNGVYTADYDVMGQLAHDVFLRSDAEMQSQGYREWKQANTENVVPSANKSNAFANSIFRAACGEASLNVVPALPTAFTYHDGYWYYLSFKDNNDKYTEYGYAVITRSRLDGSQASFWTGEGEVLAVQMIDGRLYYADGVGIYTAALAPDLQPERIMTPLGSKELINCYVNEFVVYGDGTIHSELFDIYTKKYFTRKYDVNTREIALMPTFKITQTPSINFTSNPADKNTFLDGKYQLTYKDGTRYPIAKDEINVFCDKMVADGVYDVVLEWRGLTNTYQVSLKTDFPIRDVLASESNWKYNGIRYVFDKGYMSGVDATHFAPDKELTRAMLVQILYSMENKPAVEYKQQFTDVTADKWYALAVTWAYENEITSGYENGSFGAEDAITREQAAVMLKKYAELKGKDTTKRAELGSFRDADEIRNWAKDAMSWANASGIISGKSGGFLEPGGNASRAEMATMITGFCKNILSE